MPHMVQIQPTALTISEAASYLRVSRATLYRLMSAPNSPLKTAKIGARRVVLRESLDSLLAIGAAIPSTRAAA